MLDRSIPPLPKPIPHVNIPIPKSKSLDNGVVLHYFDIAEQEVIKLDLIFESGVKYDSMQGASFMVSKMIMEGTSTKSATEIANKLDFYGAFLEASSGFDHLTVSIYTLTKFVKPVLELVIELLTDSVFPEKEFDLTRSIKIQDLEINDKKNNVLAGKQFRANLFGSQHAYGQILTIKDIEKIERETIIDFYQNRFLNRPIAIATGKIDDDTRDIIEQQLAKLSVKNNQVEPGIISSTVGRHTVERVESLQSSIRLGKSTFPKNHPDIHQFNITNNILGGYFGSRLMKNIREDKGYTYGIYSSVAHLAEASFMVISTDVKREYTEETIKEILKEIDLLKSEPMDISELENVKNYFAGQFLSTLDSPFSIAEKFKSVTLAGLDYTYYYEYLDTLKEITPDQILNTANKYFDYSGFVEVVAGGY